MNKLEEARTSINQIDKEIAKLFEKRMDAVKQVVEYKIDNNLAIFDELREKSLIKNNLEYISNDIYKPFYEKFIQASMDISKDYQKSLKNRGEVGFVGTKGAFAHIATMSLFKENIPNEYGNFEELFIAVDKGELEYGVVPFENSYTGEVGETLDLLSKYDVVISYIKDIKITQNLLSVKGSKFEDIKQVYSHPQALSQSSKFLKNRDLELIPYVNTALAAKYISDTNDKSKAAIASIEAAEIFGLDILESDINNTDTNTTRFIVISKKELVAGNRFNLLFTLDHNAGSLANVMTLIGKNGFNMANIKSRSIHNEPWKYYFYVEIEGNIKEDKTIKLIEEIKNICESLKILGSYNK